MWFHEWMVLVTSAFALILAPEHMPYMWGNLVVLPDSDAR